MGEITRSKLVPAVIKSEATEPVRCLFNPEEYTVSKQNQFSAETAKGLNVPEINFVQGGAQSLRLTLFFDSYAVEGTSVDVRRYTRNLWRMMLVWPGRYNHKTHMSEPPRVTFEWGNFSFCSVITNLSQKFTLFNKDGIPLRSTVDITFQQVDDQFAYPGQNPTSSGLPVKTHTVAAGERLDWIAAQVYEDPAQWRLIARANRLRHPLRLREGQRLVIPSLE